MAQEAEEEQLLREAKLAKAREVLETPTVWECEYCKTVNRGRFCSNCGSPRRKQEKRQSSIQNTAVNISLREDASKPQWYQDALKQHGT